MSQREVFETVDALVGAINRGDVEAAVAHYEADAVFVVQPGVVVTGSAAIRGALSELLSTGAKIVTHGRLALCTGDLALYHSRWQLLGQAGDTVAESADVLRRGRDGRWRIAIDNPWGSAVLAVPEIA
jgi:uncharacterized protein (TIGR02246 family)